MVEMLNGSLGSEKSLNFTQGNLGTLLFHGAAIGLLISTLFCLLDAFWLATLGGAFGRSFPRAYELLSVWPIYLITGLLLGILTTFSSSLVLKLGRRLTSKWRSIRNGWTGLVAGQIVFFFICVEGITHRYPYWLIFLVALLFGFFCVIKLAGAFDKKKTIKHVILSQIVILILLGLSSIFHRSSAKAILSPEGSLRPNIFFLVVDTLRADHLSCYSYARKTSPNLDQFSRECLFFSNAHSPAPATTPSTAAILGASFPYQEAFPENQMSVSDLPMPFLENLKQRGYFRLGISANPLVSKTTGFDTNFDRFLSIRHYYKDYSLTYLLTVASEQFGFPLKDLLRAQIVFTQLKSFLMQKRSETGLFCYVHFMDPHYPYIPLKKFQDPFLAKDDIRMFRFPQGFKWGVYPFEESDVLSPEELDSMVALYDASILQWDDAFGNFIEYLKENQLYEDSIIVVTADHGEAFYDHQGWHHDKSLFEEVLHVPFMIRFPEKHRVGRVDDYVSILESHRFLETFIDKGVLDETLTPDVLDVISQWSVGNGLFRGASVIRNNLKSIYVVHKQDSRRFLFDLPADAKEINNLWETTPETFVETTLDSLPPEDSVLDGLKISKEKLEELKGLGYLR